MPDITVKLVETPEEFAAVRAVRQRVFIDEQGVDPELEYDELDATAVHALAAVDGRVVGAGRLVPDASGAARIGRMAVDAPHRRAGIGGRVLRFLEEQAAARGYRQALLHAQVYVQAFYEAHGYAPEGEHFWEAGIEHVSMTRRL